MFNKSQLFFIYKTKSVNLFQEMTYYSYYSFYSFYSFYPYYPYYPSYPYYS